LEPTLSLGLFLISVKKKGGEKLLKVKTIADLNLNFENACLEIHRKILHPCKNIFRK
jgi:hypothetical protein